ncbi:tetratricopeptide repeat-containing sensor histidine kinase [Chitinophaga sancti]|uniref:histidine kinase n=2 Tax=Chitinophaga sancti TaxID=1004 RepID=A0ABZ0X8C6_9BACT|nr:histidine kinase dimerization/phosphoacceptor domain -containing protein [Chitinophaga sancti]WQD61016.1 histidine kinase dimerization/phosphoacceptor domain -containing protein [Chitinophaga sancti]WQG86857.1 histidine kinase dimerization/phosphoacceptor domain -containing protein [Chitinophaga sancti]
MMHHFTIKGAATLVALLFFITSFGQDTAKVGRLYREGQRLILKTGVEKEDMDSAWVIARQIDSFSRHTHYMGGIGIGKLLTAKILNESHRNDGRREASLEALSLLNQYGSPTLQAEALIEVGGTYQNKAADLPKKIFYYKAGAQRYLDIKDYLHAGNMLEYTGELYNIASEYRQALKTLDSALILYKLSGFPRLHGLYSLMGSTYMFMSDFSNALRYNIMAIETGEKLHETGIIMSPIYNRLGMIYFSIEDYPPAIEYFNRGLRIAYLNHDTMSIQTIQMNIAYIYRKTGRFELALDSIRAAEKLSLHADDDDSAEVASRYLYIYLEKKDYAKAALYYKRLADIYNRHPNSPSAGQFTRLALASYLQRTGHLKESMPYLITAEQEAKNREEPISRMVQLYQLFYRADSAMGNIQAELGHFKQYKILGDSFTNIQKSRQLASLQLQFETSKKDQDIQLLTQKSALQEASLQKEKIFRNVIFGGVCTLLMILVLTYNRSRLKQRSNLQLQQKQEEINDQNELLRKLLVEKEWLLKEIHHRVKNNLQIVISLLNSQSIYLDNQDAIDAIRDSQHRMHAMSLIHQKLYQTDNLATIDMSWYIKELVAYMRESFPTETTITFQLQIAPLELDVAQAVPLGLILNEAVNNAIKYAFKGRQQGIISISLITLDDTHRELCIFDNGNGLPQQLNMEETTTLGMSLMRGLSEQLDGTFEVKSRQGTIITIVFPIAQKEMI